MDGATSAVFSKYAASDNARLQSPGLQLPQLQQQQQQQQQQPQHQTKIPPKQQQVSIVSPASDDPAAFTTTGPYALRPNAACQAMLADPPTTLDALSAYLAENPGRFTYPQPPNFHGFLNPWPRNPPPNSLDQKKFGGRSPGHWSEKQS